MVSLCVCCIKANSYLSNDKLAHVLFIVVSNDKFLHMLYIVLSSTRQWGIADAEIKEPSVENQELKGSPLKPGAGQNITMHDSATARDFCLKLISTFPVNSPAFFPKPLLSFPVLAVANTSSCVGPQNKIGHPSRYSTSLMQVLVSSAHGIETGSKTSVIVFLGWHFKIVSMALTFQETLVCSINMRCDGLHRFLCEIL